MPCSSQQDTEAMCWITEKNGVEEMCFHWDIIYSDKIQNPNSNFLIPTKHPAAKSLNINLWKLMFTFKIQFYINNLFWINIVYELVT